MKNLLKVGFIAFAFGLIFISVDTANAQNRRRDGRARQEYREDVRDARQDFWRRANRGNWRGAQREYREDIREARRDYRRDSGRRRYSNGSYFNRGYYNRGYSRPYNNYYNRPSARRYTRAW